MKILAIMGSPHKDNSLRATQQIEERLAGFGDVEFDYVHLKDVELKPCKGCFVCFMTCGPSPRKRTAPTRPWPGFTRP